MLSQTLGRISTGQPIVPGDRSRTARLAIGLLAIILVLVAMASLSTGAVAVSLSDYIWSHLSGVPLSARDQLVMEVIRLPRLVMGALIGAALGVSGAVLQGLFRNPLADPGVVGISAGASLGAAGMIVLGGSVLQPVAALLGIYALPMAAFVGGLGVTFLLYKIGRQEGQTSIATLLLAGIAITALAQALVGTLIFIADDKQLRDLNFWQLGSLAGANWTKVFACGPVIVVALLVTFRMSRGLNGLFLGEAAAGHMGIAVERLKTLCIVCVAAAVGASVSVSGGIGFVGIVVPHLLRLLIGPDNRFLLPASALLGAALLIVADTIARVIVAPAELPIGIVTALAGAPFFLWILLRRRALVAGG